MTKQRCPICKEKFGRTVRWKKVCSVRCRMRAYRARKKAKAVAADAATKLEKIGDSMAESILAEHADWDALEGLARRWNRARAK